MKRATLLLIGLLLASVAQAQVFGPACPTTQLKWRISSSGVTYDSLTCLVGGAANKADTTEYISTADITAGPHSTIPAVGFLKLWVAGTTAVGTIDSLTFGMQGSNDLTNWYSQDLTGLTNGGVATILASVANTVYTCQMPVGFSITPANGDGNNLTNILSFKYLRFIVTSNVAAQKLLNSAFYYTTFRNRW